MRRTVVLWGVPASDARSPPSRKTGPSAQRVPCGAAARTTWWRPAGDRGSWRLHRGQPGPRAIAGTSDLLPRSSVCLECSRTSRRACHEIEWSRAQERAAHRSARTCSLANRSESYGNATHAMDCMVTGVLALLLVAIGRLDVQPHLGRVQTTSANGVVRAVRVTSSARGGGMGRVDRPYRSRVSSPVFAAPPRPPRPPAAAGVSPHPATASEPMPAPHS